MNAGKQFIVNNVIGYLQVKCKSSFNVQKVFITINYIVTYRILSHESPYSASYDLFRTGMSFKTI